MRMNTRLLGLVLVATLACAATTHAQERASSNEKGSILIYPSVEIRWDLEGQLIQDTFIDMTNDYPDDVQVQLYFVNGDPPGGLFPVPLARVPEELPKASQDRPDGRLAETLAELRSGGGGGGENGFLCGDAEAGSCFSSNGTPACSDLECCEAVCAVDAFCCLEYWDGTCISEAFDLCVPPEPPQNDLCENAIPVAVPSLTPGTTEMATIDNAYPACGTSITSPGVWYSVIGTGATMTATTCENEAFPGSADYDTKITVFCPDCVDPVCIDGNDDVEQCGLHSSVSWCSQAGAPYFILVHGFGGAVGDFELAVSDDETPCPDPIGCEPDPGWNWVDNVIGLTGNEPTYWSALTGHPKGVSPFTVLDPDFPLGRPDPEGSPERVLRGFIVAWAVNATGEEINWNHLKGDALIINYREGSAWEYNAVVYQAVGGSHGLAPDGTAGELSLDGTEYEASFSMLLLDFYATGQYGFSGGGLSIPSETDLTLLPLGIDFRQDGDGPITTKAKFDIWNMNEFKFSGTERCVTCWDQSLLGLYDEPNHFLRENLRTDKGKARIDAVASPVVCGDSSVDAPLVAVAMKMLDFGAPQPPPPILRGIVDSARAGTNVPGMGVDRTAEILADADTPPPPTSPQRGQELGSLDGGSTQIR